jgi:hypothetical protein
LHLLLFIWNIFSTFSYVFYHWVVVLSLSMCMDAFIVLEMFYFLKICSHYCTLCFISLLYIFKYMDHIFNGCLSTLLWFHILCYFWIFLYWSVIFLVISSKFCFLKWLEIFKLNTEHYKFHMSMLAFIAFLWKVVNFILAHNLFTHAWLESTELHF